MSAARRALRLLATTAAAAVLAVLFLNPGAVERVIAQAPVVVGSFFQPVSHDTIAVDSSHVAKLSAADLNPTGAGPIKRCLLTTETGSVRYWLDGTAPTTSTGHLLAAPGAKELDGYAEASQLLMIATSTTASVSVTCER